MMIDQPVANFVRIILEGPLPIMAYFECLHCDDRLEEDSSGWRCLNCGTFTPRDKLFEHLTECISAMGGVGNGKRGNNVR
jgi:hypothetical protein